MTMGGWIRRAALAAALLLAGAAAAAGSAAADAGAPPLVAVLGDSLSAGYGLAEGEGFVPQLQTALAAAGRPARVMNAAVSGDTSADGLRRVNFMLRKKPDIVIVALGANDMLRGLPVRALRRNLDDILSRIAATGARPLLAGMLASPNLGEPYASEFAAVYGELAKKHAAPLYPFFLQDVALVPELNLPDGLHPNAEGVAVMVQNIAPLVTAMLAEGE